ncbi:MAG: hypothetical protein ACLRVT_03845 [Oscillospiraceae bacterium]
MFKGARAARGETLAETLCAILVFALGTMLMVTMLLSAAKMNRQARERDAQLYQDFSAAELRSQSAHRLGAGGLRSDDGKTEERP